MPFQFGKLSAAPLPPPPPPFPTPTEPLAPTFGGTQRTATTNAELDTALNSSVDGDLIYIPQNTTIVLESRKTLNVSVKLYGDGASSVISTVDDYGKVSSSTTTTLVDSTKSWTTNQWTNGFAAFSFAGATLQARLIVANTDTTLTYAGASIATTNLGYTIRKVLDSNPVTAATTTVVTDSTKNWTVNRFAGCYVLIGTQLRQIASSTATTLTVSAAFSPAPTVGSTYYIFFDIPANSGAFIIPGTKSGNALNNNIMLSSMTISSPSNAVDHSCITAATLSTTYNNGITGLRLQDLTLNHTEFGVTVAADSWVIKGCTFNYIPVTGAADTSRHLGIYNIGTMGWVENCSFPATTEATPRTIAMLLTASDYDFTPGATKSGGYSGDFVVKGCSQLSGNLRQWMVMEVFKANGLNSAPMAQHGFSMWLSNNTHGDTSGGSHNLYNASGTAPLDFFDVIYTSGNTAGESTGTDKGFIAVDGLGALRSGGAPNHLYVAAANSGTAFTAPLGGAYVQGSTTTGLLAVNGTYFNSPGPNSLVTVEQVTP
jgi:hypothetical protein